MKLKINGTFVSFFTDLNISLKLDSIASTFSFKVRFNPENDEHKELFKPLQYHDVEIFNSKDKLIFTGTILNHQFTSTEEKNLLTISGYSKSGLLEDVTIPPDLYPLESLDRTLKDIATRLCNYYGVGLVIDSSASNDVGVIFQKTTAGVTDTVKGYLSKLTSQKNVLLSHDVKGNVHIFKPNDNMNPKFFFNKENTLSASSSYNGQALHSKISVVRQPSAENEGVSTADSITNPLVKKNRPITKVLSSGEDTDTSKAADNELASELKAISVRLRLLGTENFEDLLPGDIVNLHNHEIYSFAYSRYMISDINFNTTTDSSTTELSLVLPETFTGKQPKDILFYYQSHERHN